MACDKDEPKIEREMIVGEWRMTNAYGWEIEEGERWEYDLTTPIEGEDMYVAFESDGTALIVWWYTDESEPWDSEELTWTLSGNTLRLTDDYGDSISYKVERLNQTTLVYSEHYKEPGWEYYDRYTFERINGWLAR